MQYRIILRPFIVSFFLCLCALGYSQAVSRPDSMRRLLNSKLSENDRVTTLINLSRYYMYSGHFDSGYKYILPAYMLADSRKDTFGIANSANTLGLYYSHGGMGDSAFYYYDVAFKNFSLLKDSVQLAGLYNNRANVYKNQGNISLALDNYFKSLKLKEHLGDFYGAANASANLGNLYSQFDDTTNALKFLLKSLAIREKLKDTSDIANSYTSLGLYYCKKGDYSKATNYLLTAIRMLEKVGDEEGVAIACYNLGNVYYEENDFVSAEKLYKRALEYSLKNHDKEGMASCFEILGKMKIESGKVKEAIDYFKQALVVAKESNIAELQADVNNELYKAFEMTGDYKNALFYFKEWRLLKDSLFNEENIKKLTSSELKYEHEKERLVMLAEQGRRDSLAKEQHFRKNIILLCSILFLLLVSIFAFILFKRLQVNRMQKSLIEEQNREILDSIKYAKRIQNALLADKKSIQKNLPESFILYRPKDIVSGDFYWSYHSSLSERSKMETKEAADELFFLAVCDSTGHGVPGAFMSLLNIGFLNEAITENRIMEPHRIFDYVRRRLIESISQDEQKDGMDSVLLCFDRKKNTLTYAGANIGPIMVRGGIIIEPPFDKMPVGKGIRSDPFSLFTLSVEKGDRIYLFTDGYADQFGGPKGKKFMYRQLNDLLVEISGRPMEQQAAILEERFQRWRGSLEQVDDVCIIGFGV